MALSTPTLPARAGYVEIIDSVGQHVYMPTEETIEKQKQQALIENLQLKLDEANRIIDTMIGMSNNTEETE